jgi:predicted site-specific integrase-resolvase
MEHAYDLEKKYLTQQEVSDLFRVRPGTIKNWRDAGYLDYLQVPGSSRVLYPVETVHQFERQHTKRTNVIEFKKSDKVKKKDGHGLSSNRIKKQWRI